MSIAGGQGWACSWGGGLSRVGHAPRWSWGLDILLFCPLLVAKDGHARVGVGCHGLDMPLVGPEGWTYCCYVHCWWPRMGMLVWGWVVTGWTCPSLVLRVGHIAVMSLAGGQGRACSCGGGQRIPGRGGVEGATRFQPGQVTGGGPPGTQLLVPQAVVAPPGCRIGLRGRPRIRLAGRWRRVRVRGPWGCGAVA